MFKSDIEIAQETQLLPIVEVAKKLGVEDYLDNYGKYKGKIDYRILDKYQEKADGKLILVTAINPTPAGEGKTTTTVGLGDALSALGKKNSYCPSGAFFRSCFWSERGGCWRRICSGSAYGGY